VVGVHETGSVSLSTYEIAATSFSVSMIMVTFIIALGETMWLLCLELSRMQLHIMSAVVYAVLPFCR